MSRSCVCEAVKRMEMDKKSSDELADEAVISIDIRKIIRELEGVNSTIQGLMAHLRECHQGKVETKLKEKDVAALLIKASGEARQWSKGFSEILQGLSAYDRVQAFQREVVSILVQEVNREQKQKILRRIKDIQI